MTKEGAESSTLLGDCAECCTAQCFKATRGGGWLEEGPMSQISKGPIPCTPVASMEGFEVMRDEEKA